MTGPLLARRQWASRRGFGPTRLIDLRPVWPSAAFVIVLLLAYPLIVARAFDASLAFNRLAFDGSMLAALIAAIAPSVLLPVAARRPSDAGLWVLYLTGYVPSVIVPAFVLGDGWALLPGWLTLAASFALIALVVRGVDLPLPQPRLTPDIYAAILVALAGVGVVLVLLWFGLPADIPGLDETATTRDEFRDALGEAGRIAGYAVWWTGQVVAPMLLAFGAWRRNWLLVLLGLGCVVLVYAHTAFRSIAFSVLFLLVLVAIVGLRRRGFGRVFATTATVVAVGTGVLALGGWLVPASILIRRLFVVPGQVFGYYFDWFSRADTYGLSHSVLASLVPRPYTRTPADLIGLLYYGDPRIHANGNLWADGMANFGLPGIVGASVLLAIVLVVMDAASRGKPAYVAIPVGALAIWGVTNSGLLTSLITHGLAATVLLLWLLPRARRAPARARRGVAHLTSVHRADDPRIYRKECATLAAGGHAVTLVAREAADAGLPGVRVIAVGNAASRAARMALVPLRILRTAWRLRARLYHVHDPELLPVALVLKASGARVVYDAHEDLPRQIAYKTYLPRIARRPLALAAGLFEQVTVRLLDAVVAATPRIAARFPAGKTTVVQNFPLSAEFEERETPAYAGRQPHVVYLGRLTEAAGARVMADAAVLVTTARPVRFTLAGPVDPALTEDLATAIGDAPVALPGWLARGDALALLDDATVGLVVFQPEENYVESYPTKLFEYMASGLPVVASDFPVWRGIVSEAGCGLLVDPRDPSAVAEAVLTLIDDPKAAAEMGFSGRSAVLARYRWEPQGRRLLELYERLGVRPERPSPEDGTHSSVAPRHRGAR